jgi:hypothetical protein
LQAQARKIPPTVEHTVKYLWTHGE